MKLILSKLIFVTSKLCDILKPIFESILKVTVAQFRRDFLSALTVEKSKALRIKVVERQKSKT
jgi:hypothetical protein